MAPLKLKKFYFLAPTRDNPPDGPIALGNIISDPAYADEPINEVHIKIDPKDTIEHNEKNYRFTRDKTTGGRLSVWVSFLMQVLGIGGDVGLTASEGTNDEWTCQTLKTCWFTPTMEYITQSVKEPEVKDYLVKNKVWLKRAKVYMITGVKIAYGASSTMRRATEHGINLHVGVDGTSFGIPTSMGPNVSLERKDNETVAFDEADPFVFAIRLREITLTSSGEIKHRSHTDGALLSEDNNVEADDESKIEIVVEGLADEDADGEEFGLEEWDANAVDDAVPDGEACACAKTE